MEAIAVTGPAGNMLRFARAARTPVNGRRSDVSFATFRPAERLNQVTAFEAAVRDAKCELEVVGQRGVVDFRVIDRLRQVISERKPDIVQTHGVKSHFLMRLVGLKDSTKWVAFHHGYTWPNFKMSAYNQLDRWSLRKPSAIVTVCSAFGTELARIGVAPTRITVLPNSIQGEPDWTVGEVQAIRGDLRIGVNEKVVLTIGRLSAEKAHGDLLLALKRMRETLPSVEFRLIIVGDGPERAALKHMATDLGLDERVSFTGYKPRPGPYLQLADVFVLPSHSEGSPNVLLEAMASSAPVVATRVGGVPDMIRDAITGVLVPARNPDALCSAVTQMLSDRELAAALAIRAKADVSDRFTIDNYRERLLNVYDRLLLGS